MANEISSKGKNEGWKRAVIIIVPIVLVIILSYLISSAVEVARYNAPLESLIGCIYSTRERDLMIHFERIEEHVTASILDDGIRYDCEVQKKENVVYLTNVEDDIYKELVLISEKKMFSNQDSTYLWLYEVVNNE
jgi:hypothetical protein